MRWLESKFHRTAFRWVYCVEIELRNIQDLQISRTIFWSVWSMALRLEKKKVWLPFALIRSLFPKSKLRCAGDTASSATTFATSPQQHTQRQNMLKIITHVSCRGKVTHLNSPEKDKSQSSGIRSSLAFRKPFELFSDSVSDRLSPTTNPEEIALWWWALVKKVEKLIMNQFKGV